MEAAGQTPWTGGGSGRTPFSLPKCEAAGSVSRRLRYSSKNQVENRGLVRTSVEAATGGKCRRVNEFAPEVVRHQEFIHPANFRFDSRRLQPSLAVQAKVACFRYFTSYGWQAKNLRLLFRRRLPAVASAKAGCFVHFTSYGPQAKKPSLAGQAKVGKPKPSLAVQAKVARRSFSEGGARTPPRDSARTYVDAQERSLRVRHRIPAASLPTRLPGLP